MAIKDTTAFSIAEEIVWEHLAEGVGLLSVSEYLDDEDEDYSDEDAREVHSIVSGILKQLRHSI